MNLLTIKKGNRRYELQIDQVKYCIGNNFEEKFEFIKILNEVMLSSKESEYSNNNIGHAQVLLNEQNITSKNNCYYRVNHYYSINNDLKLNTHSLVAKYLEILISQNSNIDTISTINLLLESFTNELSNELIYLKFITYTPKQFLKILLPVFFKENDKANEYDLSYNELVILQLKMIDFISRNQINKSICLIEIPYLTKEINDYVIEMNNCFVIILFYKTDLILNLNDIYLFDNTSLDLNDEEQIYNTFLNKGICTLQEAKEKMKKIIETKLDMSINI